MSQAYETIQNIICEKNIYSKCSLSHCIQGHNLYPQVTGFMHAFSYKFFSFLQFTRGNLCTKIMH